MRFRQCDVLEGEQHAHLLILYTLLRATSPLVAMLVKSLVLIMTAVHLTVLPILIAPRGIHVQGLISAMYLTAIMDLPVIHVQQAIPFHVDEINLS